MTHRHLPYHLHRRVSSSSLARDEEQMAYRRRSISSFSGPARSAAWAVGARSRPWLDDGGRARGERYLDDSALKLERARR